MPDNSLGDKSKYPSPRNQGNEGESFDVLRIIDSHLSFELGDEARNVHTPKR